MSDISSFESSTLKATEIEEKNSLPTGDDINRERVHRDLLTNIGQCDLTYRAEISLVVQEEMIEWAINEVWGFKATVFVGNQVGILGNVGSQSSKIA